MKKTNDISPQILIEHFKDDYEKKLEANIDSLISLFKWEDYSSSPLSPKIPKELLKKNAKKSLREILDNKKEQERIAKGIQLIESHLDQLPDGEKCRQELNRVSEILFDDLMHLINTIEKNISSIANENFMLDCVTQMEAEKGQQNLTQPISFADKMGLSSSTLETFYNFGAQLFKENKIEDAICIFQFLCFLDAYSHEIWLALGMSHQRLKEDFFAIHCFSMASIFNPQNVLPYIYSAECLINNGDRDNALGSIALAEYFITPEKKSAFEAKIKELKISLQ